MIISNFVFICDSCKKVSGYNELVETGSDYMPAIPAGWTVMINKNENAGNDNVKDICPDCIEKMERDGWRNFRNY